MEVEEDAEEVEQRMPILKLTVIRKWQKAILEVRLMIHRPLSLLTP